MKSTIAKIKKTFYRAPLPKKKQRCVHHRCKNGKTKVYSEEQIFLHQMKLNKDRLIFE